MDTLLVADVARLSGRDGKPVTPATVRWWADTGKLKATRSVGGTRLFEKRAVEAFLTERSKKKETARAIRTPSPLDGQGWRSETGRM